MLRGRVTGRNYVTIQRFRPHRGHWTRVDKVAVRSGGGFRLKVPVRATRRWYRARAGGLASSARLVRADSTPPEFTDACGSRPVKADGTYWSCTLAEDFTGTELNRSLWVPQTIFKTGSDAAWACYLDDPSVISVHDNALHLTVRELPAPMTCPGNQNQRTPYVAGMVSTYRLFSQQFGRFEARVKNTATTAPGLHEAFWLWPDDRHSTDGWPAAGEIDISETYSRYPDLSIPFLHYTSYDNWGPNPGLNTAWNCVAPRGEFNTYTLEWTATRLEIKVNGTTCLVNASGDAAFQKPYIAAFTQALGDSGNEYDGQAPLPAEMTVDYVRIWQ